MNARFLHIVKTVILMCTCIKWLWQNNLYFGRTLDSTVNYALDVVITPRNYPFSFRFSRVIDKQYAMIGMAKVCEGYPLYAEAVNEKGLCMAGLEFPGNACYFSETRGKPNVAPFEFIPYILRQCETIDEVMSLLQNVRLVHAEYSEYLPVASLHWIIADIKKSIVVESTEEGLYVYDNPYNVLTNNPPFPYHRDNMQNYLNITAAYPKNRLCHRLSLQPYSYGMGAFGLPGDYSSPSRFVKAVFIAGNVNDIKDEREAVLHYFHMLDSVSPIKGTALSEDGKSNYTIYSSCIDAQKGIYYYKTYWDFRITAIQMANEDLCAEEVIRYSVDYNNKDIHFSN